jgi:DNA-binding transcriptional ArsR family regulator
MEPQTNLLFQAFSAQESLDLVIELLERPGTVDDLRLRLKMPKQTASRRLNELGRAGVVTRKRLRDPYEVAFDEETRQLLEAAIELSVAILKARETAERELSKRVRKTRLRPQDSQSKGTA